MNELLFNAVNAWQNKTFPHATALSKITHLLDEVKELKDDVQNGNPERRMEFADCFILLFGAAASDGMNYEDIYTAICDKMEINYQRKWGVPNENGVVNHIK